MQTAYPGVDIKPPHLENNGHELTFSVPVKLPELGAKLSTRLEDGLQEHHKGRYKRDYKPDRHTNSYVLRQRWHLLLEALGVLIFPFLFPI
jgi:hypothetical protein